MKTKQFISIKRIIILALVAFVVASYSKQSNDFLDDVYRNAAEQLNNEVMDKTAVELTETGQDQNTSSESSTNHSDEQVYRVESIQYLNEQYDIDNNSKGKAVNLSSYTNEKSLFLKVEHNNGVELIKQKPTYIVARDEVNY